MANWQQIIDRKKWEFEFQQRDVHPALMNDLWLRAIRDHMASEIKLPVKSPDYLFTAHYKGFIVSADKKDILTKFSEAVKDPEYLQYIFHRTMEVIDLFEQVVDEIMGKITKESSIEEVTASWQKLEQRYVEMVSWFWIPWYLTEENVLSNRAKRAMEKYKDEVEKIVDFNTALGILLFPVKEATFQKEQKDFYKLVKIASQNPSFESDPEFLSLSKDYLAKYSWMKTYFLLPIELLTQEDLVKHVREVMGGTFVEEYELQDAKKNEFKMISAKLLELFKDDQEVITAIKNAQELGWLLTASVEKGIFASSKSLPFLKIIAEKMTIPYKDLIHYRGGEITTALQKGIKLSEEEIGARKQATATLMLGKEINWMWGKEAEEFTEWIESGVGVVDASVKEFKGQPAFKGKVTGKVRVVLTPTESKDLIDGEVLVTFMTSPDYVPAMRRASAIVTTEGGLLSHAAIMSREFGKPCIVGTKVATTILRTGDMVEVDAEKGIVKILN